MGEEKISEMAAAAALDGTELVPLVQAGDNVQEDLAAIIATLAVSNDVWSAAWDGVITIAPSKHTTNGALAGILADTEQVATDLENHRTDASDAHNASAISILPGTFTATNVQTALVELYNMINP